MPQVFERSMFLFFLSRTWYDGLSPLPWEFPSRTGEIFFTVLLLLRQFPSPFPFASLELSLLLSSLPPPLPKGPKRKWQFCLQLEKQEIRKKDCPFLCLRKRSVRKISSFFFHRGPFHVYPPPSLWPHRPPNPASGEKRERGHGLITRLQEKRRSQKRRRSLASNQSQLKVLDGPDHGLGVCL